MREKVRTLQGEKDRDREREKKGSRERLKRLKGESSPRPVAGPLPPTLTKTMFAGICHLLRPAPAMAWQTVHSKRKREQTSQVVQDLVNLLSQDSPMGIAQSAPRPEWCRQCGVSNWMDRPQCRSCKQPAPGRKGKGIGKDKPEKVKAPSVPKIEPTTPQGDGRRLHGCGRGRQGHGRVDSYVPSPNQAGNHTDGGFEQADARVEPHYCSERGGGSAQQTQAPSTSPLARWTAARHAGRCSEEGNSSKKKAEAGVVDLRQKLEDVQKNAEQLRERKQKRSSACSRR